MVKNRNINNFNHSLQNYWQVFTKFPWYYMHSCCCIAANNTNFTIWQHSSDICSFRSEFSVPMPPPLPSKGAPLVQNKQDVTQSKYQCDNEEHMSSRLCWRSEAFTSDLYWRQGREASNIPLRLYFIHYNLLILRD